MNFTRLVPNIFYKDIQDGLKLFIDCLEFKMEYSEINAAHPFCVVSKDQLHINLFQDVTLANEHNPEFRLVTNDIEAAYKKIASTHPEFLHPNLNKITLRPWGAREFAIKDNQLGIVIQQW